MNATGYFLNSMNKSMAQKIRLVVLTGVEVSLLELDLRILFSGLAATSKEESVRHPHDVGLVHGRHLLAAVGLGVLEREVGDAATEI